VRRRHCVGSGALVIGGAPPVQKNRWHGGQKMFFQRFPKNFVLSSKLSDDFLFYFLVIENCNKINTQQKWHQRRTNKLSAASR